MRGHRAILLQWRLRGTLEASAQRAKSLLRLLGPVAHIHLGVHPQRGIQVLVREVALSCPGVHLPEAMLRVGGKRAHSELICKAEAIAEGRAGLIDGRGFSQKMHSA